jgi:hypothetical protein
VLGAADAGDLIPFTEFIAKHIADALDLAVRAAKGESIEEAEDWQKEMSLFVHQFGVEEVPAPPKSKELIKELFSNSIWQLSEVVLRKLQPLGKVFFEVECSVEDRIGNVYFSEEFLSDYWRYNIGWQYDSVRLCFFLKGFSSPVIRAFDVSTILVISWGEYRFGLSGEALNHEITGLRYDVGLAKMQIEEVSSAVAKLLFERVKEAIERLSPN